MDAPVAAALIDEAAKKSDLLWVRAPDGHGRSRPVWHVWQDGAGYVLSGGIEQPVPDDIVDRAVVTLRSKDKRARLVSFEASVTVLAPESEAWTSIVPALRAKRLNLPDAEQAISRWARECAVWRLDPTGVMLETPDDPSVESHATPPPPTRARSRVPRPLHLRGRPAKNRGGH
jgi:hypothetical protein